MEPFAALSLATNVVQFIDFSRVIIRDATKLYQSSDGVLPSNSLLKRRVQDLNSLCHGLETSDKKDVKTETELRLGELAKSCREFGQEFIGTLEELKVGGGRRKWRCLQQGLRSARHVKDIRRYEEQLGQYTSEVTAHLLFLLKERQDKAFDEQLGISYKIDGLASTLDRLEESQRRLGISSQHQPADLRLQIISSLQNISTEHAVSEESTQTSRIPFWLPSNLPQDLHSLLSESLSLQKQIGIIKSLQFPRMFEREDSIRDAHPKTLEWLFEERMNSDMQRPGFVEWLKSGTKTFWITGKAGSGKSTLMKFVQKHEEMRSALRQWSGGRHLITASYFFGGTESAIQNSQRRLFQTILYQILKQFPELVQIACPSRWKQTCGLDEQWSQEEIEQALLTLGEKGADSIRFCCFLDGLDAYQGDILDIMNTIDKLASWRNVKLCISSRPWNLFESVFGGEYGLKMKLQDFTGDDIKLLVEERLLDGNPHLIASRREFQGLIKEVINHSNGMIFWVFLVVKSLRYGLLNFDTADELQNRIREVPLELGIFFGRILDSTEKFYQQQAARLYRIRLVADFQISALDLAWFAADEPDFALKHSPVINPPQLRSLNRDTITRVNARCQDLLEFVGTNCHYVHRTVEDFLRTSDVSSELERRSGINFDPHNFLCNSLLLQMKSVTKNFSPTGTNFMKLGFLIENFQSHAIDLYNRGQFDSRLFAEMANLLTDFARENDEEEIVRYCHKGKEYNSGIHQQWFHDKLRRGFWSLNPLDPYYGFDYLILDLLPEMVEHKKQKVLPKFTSTARRVFRSSQLPDRRNIKDYSRCCEVKFSQMNNSCGSNLYSFLFFFFFPLFLSFFIFWAERIPRLPWSGGKHDGFC